METIGRNKPHFAFPKEDAEKLRRIPEGSKLTVIYPDGSTGFFDVCEGSDRFIVRIDDLKTLYDGRYCAVSAFIFAVVDGRYSVLANLRGPETPDYKGYWNCPCGFLERNEDAKTGIAREIFEECGFDIDKDKLEMFYVETEPEKCNNGNVTLRHKAFVGKQEQFELVSSDSESRGGEKGEVSEVRWIPVDEIDRYKWAFNHLEVIKELLPPKWKRKVTESLHR